jgi:hypothetical protein
MTGWELNFGHFHLGGIPCEMMDGFDTWVPRRLSHSSSQRSGLVVSIQVFLRVVISLQR